MRPTSAIPILTIALSLGITQPRAASASIVERVVAVVGDHAILLSDVRERARPFLFRVYEQVPDGPRRSAAVSQVYKVVLERMIDEELEDRAAARAGIVISSAEVDEALERVALQNGIPKEQILSEAKRSGLSEAQYREELRRQVLQSKLTGLRLQGRIKIEEADVLAAYRRLEREERMQLPQETKRLVLPRGAGAEQEARQLARAEEFARRARGGESFDALLSEPGVSAESGAYPAQPPAQEPEAIQRATLALGVGEVSAPIRLGSSLVIVQVTERTPSQLPPYEEARDAVEERVYMEKLSKARTHWLAGLRRRAHVEVRM